MAVLLKYFYRNDTEEMKMVDKEKVKEVMEHLRDSGWLAVDTDEELDAVVESALAIMNTPTTPVL